MLNNTTVQHIYLYYIDLFIHPVHGKDVVDGINAADKRFLIDTMKKIQLLEVHENNDIISTHSSTVDGSESLEK